MKKMRKFSTISWIVTLFSAIISLSSYAQNTTTIADGIVTNDYIPVAGRYANGMQHQQVIYPESMLSDVQGGTISSMTFYLSALPSHTWDCVFSVRLGITDATFFQNTVFLPTDSMLEVYSGFLTVDETTGQMTIVFSTPFVYTGGNLLLDIQNSAEGTMSVASFYGISYSINSLYTFSFFNTPWGPFQLSFIPKTTFIYSGGSTCITPTGLTIQDVDATSATVSWQAQTPGTQYQVYCDTAGAEINDADWVLTSDTSYTFNNLLSNTMHMVYLRSYCGSEQSSGSTSLSFYTGCDAVISDFPWTEDFEDNWIPSYAFGQQNNTPLCWRIYNGGTTEHTYGDGSFYWKINQNPNHAHLGQHSAVCYTEYAHGKHNDWLISPQMNLSGAQRISFYVQNNVDNTTLTDEISVWISDENVVLQAPVNDTAALSGFTQLFQTEIPVGGFQNYKISLAGYSGNRYIAFVRRNSPNAGWYLCLDDVTVENIPLCETPINLNAVPSAHDALLSWSSDATNYNLFYKQEHDSVYNSIHNISLNVDSTYLLSGLSSGSTYSWYVEADCGNQVVMPSAVATFNTTCSAISSFPQLWDFENDVFGGTTSYPLPACWNRFGKPNHPYVYNNQYAAYSGNACLYSGSQAAGIVAVLPPIDTNVMSLNMLELRLFVRIDGELRGSIEVGIMSNPLDTTSFQPVHLFDTLTDAYVEYKASFANVSSNATYIAIRMNPNDNIFIDDIILEKIPDCDRPTHIEVTHITPDSATITWNSVTDENNVYYQMSGHGTYTLAENSPVNGSSYVFNGLNPNTNYNVYISSLCTDGSEVGSSVISFTTDCIAIDSIPYTWDFEHDISMGIYPLPSCWGRIGAMAPSLYVINAPSMAHGGSHCLYSIFPNNSIAVLPNINTQELPLNTLQLCLVAKSNYGRSAMLEVGVLSEISGVTSFESISTFFLTQSYQSIDVPLINYTGNGTRLAFRMMSPNDYIVIDDVKLETIPMCLKPTNLTCVSTNASSVTLAWNASHGEENWELVYGIQGFVPDSIHEYIQLNNNEVVIDSLIQGVAYDFYVRAKCEEGAVSEWQGLFNIVPGSFIMRNFGTDTIYACEVTIYDDGGAAGNYSENCDAYLVIFPDEDNSYVEISGTLTMESSTWDYLVVYDGVGTEHELYRSTQQTNTTVAIPTITSYSGPLTIYFHSDNSVSDAGFAINTTCVSCVPPQVSVNSLGMDSVVVILEPISTAIPTYELVYGISGFSPDDVQPIVLNGVYSYTITGLINNMAYDVYARTYCNADSVYSSWSHVVSFYTLPLLPANLPYSCNFERGDENSSWLILNGDQVNQWHIGTAANNTVNGNSALYISDDNGVTNSYQPEGHSSIVWAYRDIQFSNKDEFVLSFDWKGIGEGIGVVLYDYLSVYIGIPTQVAAGVDNLPEQAVLLGRFNKQFTWTTENFILGNEYANTTKRLYFLWKNDYNSGENPPVAIDNISIKEYNCAKPMDSLSITSITDTSAVIGIIPTDGNTVAWQLRYDDNQVVTVAADSTYKLTNLIPATQYVVYARSICNNGDTSIWTTPLTFITDCKPITAASLPYQCNFENNNIGGTEEYPLPVCWQRESTSTYPTIYYLTDNGICLQSGPDPVNSIAVLPAIDTAEVNISTLSLHFNALIDCYANHTCTVEVGVMTDFNDPLTFVPVDTVNVLTYTFSEYEVLLNTYIGFGTHIAFRFNATGGFDEYGYYYFANILVDDVVLDYTSECRLPINLTNLETNTSSVKLSWTPVGNEQKWEVKMGSYGFNPEETGVVFVVDTNELTINNLQMRTAYDFYVRAYCDTNSYSEWCGPLTVIPGTYNMNTSGVDTIYTCDLMIYDNGGLFNNHSDRCDAYLVIYPDGPNSVVEISGTLLLEDYFYDYLVIYDGDGLGSDLGAELYRSYQYQDVLTTIPNVVSLTGPLTVYFHSDHMINFDGFELAVTCKTCLPPVVSVSSIYIDSVLITWNTPIQSANDFELVYGPAGFNPSSVAPIHVSGRSYLLMNLTINTLYDVYVRTRCGDAYSEWSNVCNFSTLPSIPASIPYTCDFEDNIENIQWTIVNGSQSNKWYINEMGNDNGTLYVSDNGGLSNTYLNTNSSDVWAYRDILLPDSAEFVLSFDWLCHGELTADFMFDYFQVFIGSPTEVRAGYNDIPGNAESLGQFNMQDSWTRSIVFINREHAGAIQRLYFLWHNDHTDGDNPAASIDNINIETIYCIQPIGAEISNITSNSAHVSITHAQNNVNGWQLMYGNNIVTVMNDTAITIHNLHPATEYDFFVRSICTNGDTSLWYSAPSFITDCDKIGASSLPYVCDFENNNLGGSEYYPLPACWERMGNQDYPYVSNYSYGAHQGSHYLTNDSDADDFLVILPEINSAELSINELQIRFYAKISDFTGIIDVGIMTNNTNPLTFIPLGSISNLTENYVEYEVPLSQYTGNGTYIAFRLNSQGGFDQYGNPLSACLYIDDVVLEYIPECQHPGTLIQSNIAAHSANLSWSDVASTYVLYYRETGAETYSIVNNVTLTNGSYMLTNLSPLTTYEWYVASVCSNGSLVPSHTTESFTTLCEIIGTFPYQETFENGLGCWISSYIMGYEGEWNTRNEYGSTYDPIAAAEGDYFAQAFCSGVGNVYRLSSPAFNLTSLQEPYIKFSHVQQIWGSDQDYLYIYYKTSSEAEPLLLVSYVNSIYPWRLDSIALPNPSAYYQLIFDAHLNYGYGVGVDNVVIYDNHGEDPVVVLPLVVTETVSDITQTSATLNGTIFNFNTQIVTSCGFEWKQTSGGTYVQVLDSGTDSSITYSLTNLSANTSYTYRAFATTADTIIYGDEIQFVTLEEPVDTCLAPINLQVMNISATTAEVIWTAISDESSWQVEHKHQNADEWFVQSVTEPHATITELLANTTYNVRVKAVCDEQESNYITTIFTTSVGIGDMDNLINDIVLMPNPAGHYIDLYINSTVEVEEVEIYNAMGQWIQTVPLQQQHAHINLENMASGMYFIRISSDYRVFTKKFIKR